MENYNHKLNTKLFNILLNLFFMAQNINEFPSPEFKEQPKKIPVICFKLGGTWDMVIREGQKIGSGNLDDDKLLEIQEQLGY